MRQYTDELVEQGVRVRVIGRLHEAPVDVQRSIREAEEKTRGGTRMALNIAFNYSGRNEIVDAVRALIAAGVPAHEIDEQRLGEHLYTAGQPDPDLIIRTGDEKRTITVLSGATATMPVQTAKQLSISGAEGVVVGVTYRGDDGIAGFPVRPSTQVSTPVRVYP